MSLQRRKNLIRWALGVLLAVDAALLVISLRSGASPQEQQSELVRLQKHHDLLEADVRRAAEIRGRLTQTQKECDQFFAQEFREASSGYSTVVADLSAIAGKAGLRADSVNYRPKDVGNRGVIEVEITTKVEGDYPSLVGFINGLERSKNFYVLDNLQLASGTGGNLRLNLQLRTYFRS